jgi:hypothetical protein
VTPPPAQAENRSEATVRLTPADNQPRPTLETTTMNKSMRIALMTSVALALGAVASPGAYAGSGSHVSDNAKTACMVAINANYGGKVDDLKVIHSEFSQANSEIIFEAIGIRGGSGTERWKCLVSNDGKVQDLSVVTQ